MNLGMMLPAEAFEFLSSLPQMQDWSCVDLTKNPTLIPNSDIEVIWVEMNTMVSESFLNNFPNCRFILTATTGTSHIDEELLSSRRIKLVSLRDELNFLEKITSTSEFALGLTLSVWRKIVLANSALTLKLKRNDLSSLQIRGRRIGIVGMGRIGRRLATYLKALECEIYFYDPKVESEILVTECAYQVESIEELCKQASILVICASYNQNLMETYPIIKRSHISLMPKGSVIINVARGSLLDELAAFEALEDGHLFGLGLDVLSDEDICASKINVRQKAKDLANKGLNIIVTPHIGGMSIDAYFDCYRFIAEKFLLEFNSLN